MLQPKLKRAPKELLLYSLRFELGAWPYLRQAGGFLSYSLAEASFRLQVFPSASPSAFISLLPEKTEVLTSLLFCFVIWSVHICPLCLLKWFLLSPAELTSPLMATLLPLFPNGEEKSKPNRKVGWWWTGCYLLLWFLQGSESGSSHD